MIKQRRDLAMEFRDDGTVDLNFSGADLEAGSEYQTLDQALKLRLLVQRGELRGLAHPRYGSRVHELIGELPTRANLELLRRYVLEALRSDPRVKDISKLEVTALRDEPGIVDVYAVVVPDPRTYTGGTFEFGVQLDVG